MTDLHDVSDETYRGPRQISEEALAALKQLRQIGDDLYALAAQVTKLYESYAALGESQTGHHSAHDSTLLSTTLRHSMSTAARSSRSEKAKDRRSARSPIPCSE